MSKLFPRRGSLALLLAAGVLGAMSAVSWCSGIDEALAAWAAEQGSFRAKGSGLRDFLRILTFAGKTDVQILLALFIGALGAVGCCWRVLLALAVCSAMVLPLKAVVGRERPDSKDSYSFPSGDVASAASAATVIAFRFPGLAPVCAAAVAGVAVMRMFEGAHHLADVLAGAAFGLLAAWAALLASPRIFQLPRRVGPPWLVRGMLLLTVACLIPAVVRGGGVFLDFSEAFLPLILMALGWKLFPGRYESDGEAIPVRTSSPMLFSLLISVSFLCVAAAVSVWFLPLVKLRLALFGLALVIGVGCAARLWSERWKRRGAARFRLSTCALAAAFSLLLLVGPAMLRHEKEEAARASPR